MAVKLAHLGATDQMIAAWLAHNGTGEVHTYTKNVEREKLVESSRQLLGWDRANLKWSSPTFPQLKLSHGK